MRKFEGIKRIDSDYILGIRALNLKVGDKIKLNETDILEVQKIKYNKKSVNLILTDRNITFKNDTTVVIEDSNKLYYSNRNVFEILEDESLKMMFDEYAAGNKDKYKNIFKMETAKIKADQYKKYLDFINSYSFN